MPGASATVQVRGVTTMSDSSPLILVDGMMVSSLDNIASEDVQQITVLKDAASASIYGARAAAGVILITTKEATEGQLSIGYNGEISLSSPTEFPKFLTDPYHYMTMYNELVVGTMPVILREANLTNYSQDLHRQLCYQQQV